MNKKGIAAGAATVLALASAFLPGIDAIQRIQKHEGTVYTAYLDPVNVVTICTGSTKNVRLGMVASKGECDRRLYEDLASSVASVRRNVTVPITQGQFDSLVSFTFNVGDGAFARSTLLKRINAGDCYGAAKQFDQWVYAKGKKLPGLVTRRADERLWFERDCKLWE